MTVNPNQAIAASEARHGGPEVAVVAPNGAWVLYPNGARRDINPMGLLLDPPKPSDVQMSPYHGDMDRLELELLNRKIQYWDAKIENLSRDHNRLLESMLGTDYSNEQLAQIKSLANQSKKARKQMEGLIAERSKNPIHVAFESRPEAEAERDRRIAEKSAALKQMRI